MATRVALLRGVNVGAHRRIRMDELRATLAAAGFASVRTVGQSGNLVVDSPARPAALERELRELLGVEVVVRTVDELQRVLDDDPLRGIADNGSRALVTFLVKQLPAADVRALRAAAVEPELVAFAKREIYSWHPNGLHESPLAKALAATAKALGGTNRNRNTVEKLFALAV